MKKYVGYMLAASLTLSMGMTVAAADETTKFDSVGIEFSVPQMEDGAKGAFFPEEAGPIDDDHHTYMLVNLYFAMPAQDVVNGLNDEDLTEEEYEKIMSTQTMFSIILSTDKDIEAAKESYEIWDDSGHYPMDFDSAKELGTADGYTFYKVPGDIKDYVSGIDEEYAKQLDEISQAYDKALENAKLYAPVDELKSALGKKIEFTTTDTAGNTVTSKELFSKNKVTMLNAWGSWCPHCVNELGELGKIYDKYKDKGFGIVGIDYERTPDEATYKLAEQMLKDNGATYPNVIYTEEVPAGGFPTSTFVDSEGNVLCMPVSGARVDLYESLIEKLLAGEDVDKIEDGDDRDSMASTADSVAGYNVLVKDESGNPVEGAMIQLCDDTTCNFAVSDAEGKAHFDVRLQNGSKYEVHVLKAPDGYAADENVYDAKAGSGDMTIELKKA